MNHGSLFSGIGGFDLAAEWVGWNNLFHCEWNPFGQKVLKHYWPHAESFNDITQTDFKKYANQIDILTGGFPCQPYSSAGKRKGKDDERHLWPEMLRAISEIRPRWVVGENVFGLVNWSAGLVFHEVQADLEAQGYEVQPFLLPAAAVNAPHRRDRIWFVAYSIDNRYSTKPTEIQKKNRISRISRQKMESWKFDRANFSRNATNTDSNGQHECNGNDEINASERGINAQRNIEPGIINGDATDTDKKRFCGQKQIRKLDGREFSFNGKREHGDNWSNFPTQPPICGGNDGLPAELDGITFSKWRNESIKGYGNAIVPQVVFQIFKAIQEYELQKM